MNLKSNSTILCFKITPDNFLLHCYNRPCFIISETATDVIEETFKGEEHLSAHLANLPAWWHYVCHTVVGGSQTFLRDCEESIPRTQARETVMWPGSLFIRVKGCFWVSHFLLPSISAWEKSNRVFSKVKTKDSV